MKKKLKLSELEVNSFITSNSKNVGGADLTISKQFQECGVPSVNACPTLPLNDCNVGMSQTLGPVDCACYSTGVVCHSC